MDIRIIKMFKKVFLFLVVLGFLFLLGIIILYNFFGPTEYIGYVLDSFTVEYYSYKDSKLLKQKSCNDSTAFVYLVPQLKLIEQTNDKDFADWNKENLYPLDLIVSMDFDSIQCFEVPNDDLGFFPNSTVSLDCFSPCLKGLQNDYNLKHCSVQLISFDNGVFVRIDSSLRRSIRIETSLKEILVEW